MGKQWTKMARNPFVAPTSDRDVYKPQIEIKAFRTWGHKTNINGTGHWILNAYKN